MKVRIRKSSLKRRKRHGFRAKPDSYRRRTTKLKELRRRRRKKKNWTIHRKNK